MVIYLDEETSLITCDLCKKTLARIPNNKQNIEKIREAAAEATCYPICDTFQFRHRHPSERPGYRMV